MNYINKFFNHMNRIFLYFLLTFILTCTFSCSKGPKVVLDKAENATFIIYTHYCPVKVD